VSLNSNGIVLSSSPSWTSSPQRVECPRKGVTPSWAVTLTTHYIYG